MTTYRWIPALILGGAFLIVPGMDANAGPADRMRKTDCGEFGCHSTITTLAEKSIKAQTLRKERQRLATPPSPNYSPPPSAPNSITIKFDKTDPLYRLLMRHLIEESKARKQLMQSRETGDSSSAKGMLPR